MKHIFGPVSSRRLGRSLGIDLIPHKTCPYNCIYCQVGRTTNKTMERKEFVPFDDVVSELAETLEQIENPPDFITLSGSGEPTLYSRTGELIDRVKNSTGVPVAVITGGSMLHLPEVRESLMNADLVVPSLDAGDQEMFEKVNRPHGDLSFDTMLEGLIRFRRKFRGPIWLEVFILEGISTVLTEAGKIAACADRVKPDRIQLNTAVRPTAEAAASEVPKKKLDELARIFIPEAEIIAAYKKTPEVRDERVNREAVLQMLKRRPCTLDDIADGLELNPNLVVKHLDELVRNGFVELNIKGERLFYCAL